MAFEDDNEYRQSGVLSSRLVKLNNSVNNRLLRPTILVVNMVVFTLLRVILTWSECLKLMFCLIFLSVNTAIPNAHKQKLRIPVS